MQLVPIKRTYYACKSTRTKKKVTMIQQQLKMSLRRKCQKKWMWSAKNSQKGNNMYVLEELVLSHHWGKQSLCQRQCNVHKDLDQQSMPLQEQVLAEKDIQVNSKVFHLMLDFNHASFPVLEKAKLTTVLLTMNHQKIWYVMLILGRRSPNI